MASIRTAIELQDNFTGVLYQVIDSVNLGLSAMEDLHQAMDLPASTASFDGARDSINQATMSVQGLIAAMQQADAASAAPSVQWQAGGTEVFTGSGMERFRQEAQSMNAVLGQLSAAQDAIARQAYNTNVLPPAAFRDLNSMAVRVDALKGRIQELSSNPVNMGTDAANAELERLRGQLGQAVREQQALNQAVDCMDVQAANAAYLRLDQIISGTERHIRDNVDGQGRFNQEIQEGVDKAGDLMGAVKRAVAAYATFQTVTRAMGLSDQVVSTTARLDMMNDGLQTTQDLQGMIFLSAERARGSYQATADAVSKLGLMAGNAFSGSGEIIAFMEQINKQFAIAGTEASGIQAAMLQLTQAMGSGVLRGEEYNSILEQAPNIIQNIAGYIEGNEEVLGAVAKAMGMKVEELAGNVQGHLKDIAGEGILSAELVKAAMFYAAEETNEKFESMPKTFGQVWTSFQNNALMAFQPVLERMNEVANSEAFQDFADSALEAVEGFADAALWIFDHLIEAGGFVAENWELIGPILMGAAAASGAVAAAMGIQAAATWVAKVANDGLVASLMANPFTLIFVAVAITVAMMYKWIQACGGVSAAWLTAQDNILTGWDVVRIAFQKGAFFVQALGDSMVVGMVSAGVGMADAAGDMKVKVLTQIEGMVNGAIDLLNDFIDAVNQIPGAAIPPIDSVTFAASAAVQNESDKAHRAAGLAVLQAAQEDYAQRREWYLASMERQAVQRKMERLAGIAAARNEAEDLVQDEGHYPYEPIPYNPDSLSGIGSGVDDIAGNTGAIADAMEISEEELKYMRDLAEQETINRFTTAKITIDQSGMQNTIKNKDDFGSFMALLTDSFGEAVEMAAEGVHQ